MNFAYMEYYNNNVCQRNNSLRQMEKGTIMLDKVCAYACNYARDGVVHQYFWQWSSLTFKAHWNEGSTWELTRLMYVLNYSTIFSL